MRPLGILRNVIIGKEANKMMTEFMPLCCRCLGLSQHPYIFMRWKEMFFMNADEESGLTIAGFYYICFCRSTGKVSGYAQPLLEPLENLMLCIRIVSICF